jgi:hypothetical protein
MRREDAQLFFQLAFEKLAFAWGTSPEELNDRSVDHVGVEVDPEAVAGILSVSPG